MKTSKKRKFDIKAFFICHVEKIVLALIVPLAIFIAWQGTKYEPLKWQPSDLQRISEAANSHIRTNQRKAIDEGVSIFPYDTYAGWIKVGVRPGLYQTDTLWMPPLFPEKIKRGAVPVFPVYDLKAQSGLGAIVVNPSSPLAVELTNPRIGKRWTVVTGLIPIKRQLDDYVAAYSSSIFPDPMRDTPFYVFYDVERTEIEPGKNAENLNWTKLDLTGSFVKNTSLWSTFASDPVDPTYVAPMAPGSFPMAYPLPPVEKPFGEEVAHPPVVPMLTDTQMQLMKSAERVHQRLLDQMFDVRAEDFLSQDPFSGGGAARGNAGRTPGTVPRDRRRDKVPEEEEVQPILVTDYLFRFFDFDVESGKTYRYRVRLYLANPNYKLGENNVVSVDLTKERHLITEFSTPSNMVTIPLESRILGIAVTAPNVRTPWSDPVAGIMAVHFDLSDGTEWYVEKERVLRGATINYAKQDATNGAAESQVAAGAGGAAGTTRPGARPPQPVRPGAANRPPAGRPSVNTPAAEESQKTIDIVSDVCVLDMLGGVGLIKTAVDAPDLRSPGRIMVLEPSGNMVIRNVCTDLAEVERIKHPVSTTRELPRRRGGL